LKYSPLDIYIFNNKFFSITESGFWEETKEAEITEPSNIENIYLDNPFFTLIPEELSGHIPIEEKKRFISDEKLELIYLEDKISKYQTIIYWGIDKEIKNAIKKNFPTANLKHFCESMIMSSNFDFQLKYFLGEECIYIASFNNKKLVLVNRYKIENSEDSLYFILSVVKESKFINESFNIEHSGIENKKLVSKLKSVFPEIMINYNQQSNIKKIVI
jgi:hypothetical protein|tara:strand:+ start:3846 stop:4496 length:651 start_codon:yes stop_codon:yes gene_type:complete